jgi:hypothetical protein
MSHTAAGSHRRAVHSQVLCRRVTGSAPEERDQRAAPRTIGGYDYVTIGHVTVDVVEEGHDAPRSQPGGGAFYSALQAARLGLRTLIVTKGAPAEMELLLAPYRKELDAIVLPSEHTTTLLTRGSGPARRQWVRAWAGPIDEPLQVRGSIVHFAPVACEIPAQTRVHAAFVGLTPQGLVRAWGEDGLISLVPLDPRLLPAHLHAAVLSEAERASCAPLLERNGPPSEALVAITAGSAPIELRVPGSDVASVLPIQVEHPREDLGAGDVFAAALFVALWRGHSALDATRCASAAAALRMLGKGPASVGDAEAIETLLSRSKTLPS